MGHLIHVEVINTIQMLDVCKVCAASMMEAFQRNDILDSLLKGNWKCEPWAWAFASAVNSSWRFDGIYSGKPSMIAKDSLMPLLGSYVILNTLLQ